MFLNKGVGYVLANQIYLWSINKPVSMNKYPLRQWKIQSLKKCKPVDSMKPEIIFQTLNPLKSDQLYNIFAYELTCRSINCKIWKTINSQIVCKCIQPNVYLNGNFVNWEQSKLGNRLTVCWGSSGTGIPQLSLDESLETDKSDSTSKALKAIGKKLEGCTTAE